MRVLPRLLPDWRQVLLHAWSARLNYLSALCSSAELILPLWQDDIPRGLFAALAVLASLLATYFRIIPQKRFHDGKDHN